MLSHLLDLGLSAQCLRAGAPLLLIDLDEWSPAPQVLGGSG